MARYVVHLIGGQSVPCFADDSEVDSIFDSFIGGSVVINFENASFKTKDISGLEYPEKK